MSGILLTGGRVIDPATGTDTTADVAIEGGLIAAIGPKLDRSPASEVVDVSGCLVTPGLIDPHVHFREPGQEHKETIQSGSLAAVAGGFTAVVCMPNTSPAIDCPELVRFVYDRARELAACRVFPSGCVTRGRKGEGLAEIASMADAPGGGAVAFTDDGDVIASAGLMARALEVVRETGRPLLQHAQEPTLTVGASMHAGDVAARLGLGGWPRVAEELIVERDVRLNRGIGCRYHVQHISSAGTIEIIRQARERGEPVSGEASPHHLLLTHEACEGFNTDAKMNPPLREWSDVQALREAVAEGVLTVLATDHAPHTPDEKAAGFEDAPFGIIGLETAVGAYAEALIESGAIGWPRLIELLTVEPAGLCGLDAAGLGRLVVGGVADVTVIDPDAPWTVQPSVLAGRSRNTPFMGRSFRARPVLTIVDGRVRHRVGSKVVDAV